jgi:hypothetical protein
MEIAKTCSHRKLDGTTCRSLAVRDRRYCYYHERYFDRDALPKTDVKNYALAPFEDTRSILFTIHQLISSYLNSTLDENKFTKCIYALQVAAQYAGRPDALSPDAAAQLAEERKQEQVRQEQKKRESKKTSEPSGDDIPPLASLLADTLAEYDAGTLIPGRGGDPEKLNQSPDQKMAAFVDLMQNLMRPESEASVPPDPTKPKPVSSTAPPPHFTKIKVESK